MLWRRSLALVLQMLPLSPPVPHHRPPIANRTTKAKRRSLSLEPERPTDHRHSAGGWCVVRCWTLEQHRWPCCGLRRRFRRVLGAAMCSSSLVLRRAHECQIAICQHQKRFGQHPKPACPCGSCNKPPNRGVLRKGARSSSCHACHSRSRSARCRGFSSSVTWLARN